MEQRLRDERALIVAAKSGDRAAFDTLLRGHLAALRARACGALRHRPDLDPDEIVQQTMVRSYEAFGVFDERYRFSQYLFGIAKYILRRHLCATVREIAVAWDEASDDVGLRDPHPDSLPDAARALAGVDRFPRPDRHAVDRARLCELIEAVMLHGGYPHQQIAFAYGTMLWGKRNVDRGDSRCGPEQRSRPDKKPITSDPDRVVRELSEVPLAEAGAQLRSAIEASEGLAAEDLDAAFAPFEFRISLSAQELFSMDPVSRRRLAGMSDRVVGGTRLSDYYGANPRKSIADWIAAVKKRTARHLLGQLDPARTTLPMPVGHDITGRPSVENWDRGIGRAAGPKLAIGVHDGGRRLSQSAEGGRNHPREGVQDRE